MLRKGWIIVTILGIVVVTGVILIALWRTGKLVKGGSGGEGTVPGTGGINIDPFQESITTFDPFNSFTLNYKAIDIAVNATGSNMAEVFTANGRNYVSLYARFERDNWGDGRLISNSFLTNFTPFGASWNRGGTWVAILGQTSTHDYILRIMPHTGDSATDITLFTGTSLAAITPDIFSGEDGSPPIFYAGYKKSSVYYVVQVSLLKGTWTKVALLQGTYYRLLGVSRQTLVMAQAVTGGYNIVPFHRADTTETWTTAATIDAHDAYGGAPYGKNGNCVITNEGRVLLLLRQSGISVAPEAFHWTGSTFASLGKGTSLGVGHPSPNKGFVLASSSRSDLFTINFLGSGPAKGWMRLYAVPSITTHDINPNTVKTTDQLLGNRLKQWDLFKSYIQGVFVINWSNVLGLEVEGGLINTGATTDSFHLYCY